MSSLYEHKVLQYLKNYLVVAEKVKEIILRLDPKAKVYVFGSVVRGDYIASSDIDILVITSDIKLKYDLIVAVYKEIDAPVELHIVTQELFEKWYKKFIKSEEIVEV